jgi:shikimate dehydrogenase
MVAKHFAVLGSPIANSKSPQIHSAAYKELGLDWQYDRHEVDEDSFKRFIEANDHISGVSLTMPLKTVAYEYALGHRARIDSKASLLRSVNTLVRGLDGLKAFNTDVFGVTEAFRTAELPSPATVAILGSGATSRSVLLGVLNYFDGVERVNVFSRNSDAAAETLALLNSHSANSIEGQWLPLEAAADFGGADLTCNTLPADVAAEIEVDVPLSDGWLFDVAYNPWPSTLSLGWPVDNRISGLEMLLNQALAQIRIFVNGDPNIALESEGHVFAQMRAACD